MKFTLPTATRKRLDELLTLLGNRAEDFKKCFDIESEWCWKYADLVLRGMEHRELNYGERHHIVPRSFYGVKDVTMECENNLTLLSYEEHVFTHYCAAKCAVGDIKGKLSWAFWLMYNRGTKTKKLPPESEVISSISNDDFAVIRLAIPHISKVEEDGRPHKWEVSEEEYRKSLYNAHYDRIIAYQKKYRTENCDAIAAKRKEYYELHRDEICAKRREYVNSRKEELYAKNKVYRDTHQEQIKARKRTNYLEHREERLEYRRATYNAEKNREINRRWLAKHPEWRSNYNRQYYAEHRDELREKARIYNIENSAAIKEKNHEFYANNKDAILINAKEYYQKNKERIKERERERRAKKVALGYRERKDPITGKKTWVFVGNINPLFVAKYDPNYVELDGGVFEPYYEETGT